MPRRTRKQRVVFFAWSQLLWVITRLAAPSHSRGASRSACWKDVCRSGNLHFRPALAGIETLHRRGLRLRLYAEVRLINLAVLVDDERHDAGVCVSRRIRDDSEAADRAP